MNTESTYQFDRKLLKNKLMSMGLMCELVDGHEKVDLLTWRR